MTDFASKPLNPKVVLAVIAHPDDMEFMAAGTMAKFIASGAKGYCYVLTNANKGTSDRSMDPDRLRDLRREEQRQAGKVLGLSDVFYGDYDDGRLECTMDVKRDVARVIRQVKPDVVITWDPSELYAADYGVINHPDHRAAGQAALDAVYPLARDHLSFPELLDEGYEPHKTPHVLLINFEHPNYCVDITDQLEAKLRAIAAHSSQIPDQVGVAKMVQDWAGRVGAADGMQCAESFVRIDTD